MGNTKLDERVNFEIPEAKEEKEGAEKWAYAVSFPEGHNELQEFLGIGHWDEYLSTDERGDLTSYRLTFTLPEEGSEEPIEVIPGVLTIEKQGADLIHQEIILTFPRMKNEQELLQVLIAEARRHKAEMSRKSSG